MESFKNRLLLVFARERSASCYRNAHHESQSDSRNDEQIDNSIPLYRHCERSEAIHKENPLAKNAKSVESLKVFSDFIESSDKIN